MSAQAIFAILLGWTVAAFVFGLLFARAIPASPEPDEHEACHGDPEWRRAIGEPGMIDNFHNGSNLTQERSNHG